MENIFPPHISSVSFIKKWGRLFYFSSLVYAVYNYSNYFQHRHDRWRLYRRSIKRPHGEIVDRENLWLNYKQEHLLALASSARRAMHRWL